MFTLPSTVLVLKPFTNSATEDADNLETNRGDFRRQMYADNYYELPCPFRQWPVQIITEYGGLRLSESEAWSVQDSYKIWHQRHPLNALTPSPPGQPVKYPG